MIGSVHSWNAENVHKKIKDKLLQLTKAYYRKELDDTFMDNFPVEVNGLVDELMTMIKKESARPLPCGCPPGWCQCD